MVCDTSLLIAIKVHLCHLMIDKSPLFPQQLFLPGGKNETHLVSFCCWLIVSSLSPSLQASQTLWCSAANKLQGCCKACFFSLHVFLHNGGSLVEQNRTNHRRSRAESPCAWAGIQEDMLPMVNHHPNNVSQFIRG